MAQPRQSGPDITHHVMAHAVADLMLFADDHERLRFLTMLLEAKRTYGFRLYAYCLMSNHFHLLIRTAAAGITEIMQSLLTRYGWLFNTRRSRRGYVFDKRFKSPICDTDSYRLEAARYIVLNPVKAGIVASPEEWAWSSHNILIGNRPPTELVDSDEVLSWFGDDVDSARRRYLEFVSERSEEADLRIDATISSGSRIVASTEEESVPQAIEELAQSLCLEKGISMESLKGGSAIHRLSRVRRDFTLLAVRGGYKPIEVSRFLGRSKALISRFLAEGAREQKSKQ